MKEKVLDVLKKYNQEHLLHFVNELTEEEKNLLENQILSIDFAELKKYKDEKTNTISENIEPMSGYKKQDFTLDEQQEITNIGEDIIKKGEYALVTLAGRTGYAPWTYRTKRNV